MNVVDSCGWLEYFSGGPNAAFFAPALEDTDNLLVPVICCYEVYKRMLLQRGETDALEALSSMHHGQVLPVTERLAIDAARLSLSRRLPMADSLILATARANDAELWTQDADFRGLEGVRFVQPA